MNACHATQSFAAQLAETRSRADADAPLVLVVDDDRDIRESLTELLELENYRVASARHGAEALELARAERPALILLDLFMPVMDGEEFRRRQREDPELSAIPVVVMSAAAGLAERIADLEVAEHLEKPLGIDHFFEVVARFARRQ